MQSLIRISQEQGESLSQLHNNLMKVRGYTRSIAFDSRDQNPPAKLLEQFLDSLEAVLREVTQFQKTEPSDLFVQQLSFEVPLICRHHLIGQKLSSVRGSESFHKYFSTFKQIWSKFRSLLSEHSLDSSVLENLSDLDVLMRTDLSDSLRQRALLSGSKSLEN
jgi:hypothetical protein